METIYSYKIKSNNVSPMKDGMELVITKVYMEATGVNSGGFRASFGWYFDLPAPSPASYTPFSDVSEEMMIKWVIDMYPENVKSLCGVIDSKIKEDMLKNEIENYPLPFA